jgi:DNA mismatch repair protein MutS
MSKYTPMIEQYLNVKAQYNDAFLFFRLGDFYELFFEDAVKAAHELEITLTSRDGRDKENRIPMCGVPHHSAKNYISKLIGKGYKVAICEQVEDPKQTKGMVRREVVQVVTPGTVMDGDMLNEKENNYIIAVSQDNNSSKFGLAICDLSTGQTKATEIEGPWKNVIQELNSLGGKECIFPNELKEEDKEIINKSSSTSISYENETHIPEMFSSITDHLEVDLIKIACGRLLNYLVKTQKRSLDHLQIFEQYSTNQFLKLDLFTKRNLELTETSRSKDRKGSLLWLLDQTVTAMGGRLLKQWVGQPLIKKEAIERRHEIVDQFVQQFFYREEIRDSLKEVYDLERLAGKISFGNVNARDLIQLKKSLQKIPHIQHTLSTMDHESLGVISNSLYSCDDLVTILDAAIMEEPPLSITDGGIIKDNYNKDLDRYRDASRNGKQWIADLERAEKEASGIKSLKIGYNKVFGYYIEVTRSNLHLVDTNRYERKQTLANAERFITEDLKEKEAIILEAEEKMVELEYSLFSEIREQIKQYIDDLQRLAKQISELDVLQSFATVSEHGQYIRPTLSDDSAVEIRNGRHPVVEKVIGNQDYVANDVFMDNERELLLITGPNMAGKSTYMRQLALISILAQVGCFVPAEKATLPIFDQIFTRIGAADDLVSGQSTFMVEMLETNFALSHATDKSLLLLDEIGRGTSTYDGMSLAQAIIEYIHYNIGAKTLFSTHYHELTVLEEQLPRLKNIHVKAIEENGKVVFLHKVHDGKADQSYGIHVAQLAQLPDIVITRAQELLHDFEQQQPGQAPNDQVENENVKEDFNQLSFFEAKADKKKEEKQAVSEKEKKVIDQIKSLNLLDMTPIDTMNELYALYQQLKK